MQHSDKLILIILFSESLISHPAPVCTCKHLQITIYLAVYLSVTARVHCATTVTIYYNFPSWDTKGNPKLSTYMWEKLAVPVQTRSTRDVGLNCLFREPQHCCSWQEHWDRAMETSCQRSEDLNHTPIHLLSRTPQSKKKQGEPTEVEWQKDSESKKKIIKLNRVKWQRPGEDEWENLFVLPSILLLMPTLPTCP